jgi:hypothetical protein
MMLGFFGALNAVPLLGGFGKWGLLFPPPLSADSVIHHIKDH